MAKKTIRITAQPGPQWDFLATEADICVFGGSAGGGKTYALLLSALMYKNVHGFNCTIFRRTFKQVFSPGGLWDTAHSIYGAIQNAEMRKVATSWEFVDKNGAAISKVTFAHIESFNTVDDWQGSQLCEICCEVDTPVLMADGTYKKVRDIRTGDYVATLQGARRINAVGRPHHKECVRAELPDGRWQVHSTNHKLLTKGGWMSYEDIINPAGSQASLRDVVVQEADEAGKNRCVIHYEHPYRHGKEMTSLPGAYEHCPLKMIPVGERTVVNITVDDCNHYITKSGLINRNCFDELTHFDEQTFFYMMSRNRSTCGVKPFIRATCNPDADSWVAKFIEWWIDPDTGYPIQERSGKIRWFIRRDGKLYWADTKEELWEQFNLVTNEEKDEPRSFTFIMSSIYNNKELLKVNPQYLSSLKALPEVERERLLHGNWKIKPSAGMFFKRSQVGEFIQVIPRDVTTWVRCWDLAATEKDENGDAAYTAGVLIGKRKNGRYVIADVINKQISASDVRTLIKHTAQLDRAKYKRVRVRLPQDPGQAGKEQAQSYIKWLSGFDVTTVPESGSKESRAEPMAAQWQAGNFDIFIAPWNEEYLNQMENFPEGKYKDMVDASANGFAEVELKSQFNVGNLL